MPFNFVSIDEVGNSKVWQVNEGMKNSTVFSKSNSEEGQNVSSFDTYAAIVEKDEELKSLMLSNPSQYYYLFSEPQFGRTQEKTHLSHSSGTKFQSKGNEIEKEIVLPDQIDVKDVVLWFYCF
jgi:hypothetical protein